MLTAAAYSALRALCHFVRPLSSLVVMKPMLVVAFLTSDMILTLTSKSHLIAGQLRLAA